MRARLLIVGLVLLGVAGGVFAEQQAQYENVANIQATAENFVRQHMQAQSHETLALQANKLDSRIRLDKCTQPLQATLPSNLGRATTVTVKIGCSAPKPWKIYVPVQVKLTLNVLVAAHGLPKAHRLVASDVQIVEKDKRRLNAGFFPADKKIIGMETSRRVSAGAAFSYRNLSLPSVIKKGEAVVIIVGNKHMQVEMKGIAQENGAKDQIISVMNKSSKRIIDAKVIGSGKVKVEL